MFSRAEMISSLEADFLAKLRRRLNALLVGRKVNDEGLGAAGFRLAGFLADLFARHAALAGDLFDERQHLLRVALTDDLQQHGLRRRCPPAGRPCGPPAACLPATAIR